MVHIDDVINSTELWSASINPSGLILRFPKRVPRARHAVFQTRIFVRGKQSDTLFWPLTRVRRVGNRPDAVPLLMLVSSPTSFGGAHGHLNAHLWVAS